MKHLLTLLCALSALRSLSVAADKPNIIFIFSDDHAQHAVFYCGGGWRSSVAFFHAWLLGFENIRNYSDGWSGWSTEYLADPAAKGRMPGWRQQPSRNPIAAGAPP